MKTLSAVSLSLAIGLALGAPLSADEPVVSGENGIAAPRKTKNVLPVYPPEAQARGERGIVIVELVINTEGKVASARVVRSIPPFDEAALAAVRQWEYEVTRVNGKPVSVRHTVPITFALKIPEIASRQEGIPELRAGALPPIAPDARDTATATAELTLGSEGNVEELRIVDGPPAYADALARALRTWRFAPEPSEATVTFLVHAQFNPSAKSPAPRVAFRLDGLRRSESMAAANSSAAAPAPPPASAPQTAVPAPQPEPAPASAPAKPSPASPEPTAAAAAAALPVTAPRPPTGASYPAPSAAPATALTASTPSPTPAAAAAKVSPTVPPAAAAAPKAPPVEVLSVPPPAEPPENGLSAVRDVTLSPGVPDLTRGRRPVPPPLARMAQATGTIDVKFSVDAAGIAAVKGSTGPDVFKRAAEQAVSSWTFRRTRADRIFLLAEFKYTVDAASATVRPDTN
jgi:TonB family protein